MQVKVNDEVIFELSDIQKKVICHDIHEDDFDEDMKRRIKYIVMHKYERCLARLKAEFSERLAADYGSIPSNDENLARLIFDRPDYLCRKKREEAN